MAQTGGSTGSGLVPSDAPCLGPGVWAGGQGPAFRLPCHHRAALTEALGRSGSCYLFHLENDLLVPLDLFQLKVPTKTSFKKLRSFHSWRQKDGFENWEICYSVSYIFLSLLISLQRTTVGSLPQEGTQDGGGDMGVMRGAAAGILNRNLCEPFDLEPQHL